MDSCFQFYMNQLVLCCVPSKLIHVYHGTIFTLVLKPKRQWVMIGSIDNEDQFKKQLMFIDSFSTLI